jgi:hypothetical protein
VIRLSSISEFLSDQGLLSQITAWESISISSFKGTAARQDQTIFLLDDLLTRKNHISDTHDEPLPQLPHVPHTLMTGASRRMSTLFLQRLLSTLMFRYCHILTPSINLTSCENNGITVSCQHLLLAAIFSATIYDTHADIGAKCPPSP